MSLRILPCMMVFRIPNNWLDIMKNIIPITLSILLFLGGFITAHATEPLSEGDVQHFMNAYNPVQKLGNKYDFDDDKDDAIENIDPADFTPMSYALERVKNHEAYEEFKTIISTAGFSSPQQWANVGDRVMGAFTSLKIIEEMTPEKIQEMLKSIEDVKKNEYLSPEIKKQLLESLTQMVTMSDNISHDEKADQNALKPYLARLERLFEERQ